MKRALRDRFVEIQRHGLVAVGVPRGKHLKRHVAAPDDNEALWGASPWLTA